MTATTLPSQRYSTSRDGNSSSSWLAQLLSRSRPEEAIDVDLGVPLTGGVLSTGVSASAIALEQWARRLGIEALRWKETLPQKQIDIEQDIAVLLPPKRQYRAKIQIHYIGRAQPFVGVEDILIEPENL